MTGYPNRKILVMGFPRSGTKFFAHCLRTCFGWDVGHEHMESDGAVGFQYAKWNKHSGAPALAFFQCVVQLVRDPRAACPSVMANLSYIPGFNVDDVQNAWTDWNVLCEQRLIDADNGNVAVHRIKIEHFAAGLHAIGRQFDLDPDPIPDVRGEYVNHRKETKKWRWETLRPTTQWFARRYGYSP